ncbi:MAG: Sir2 family NAD-dependent protein deacetylase, partial [Jatrophihabitantaceae bacterium]
MTVLADPVAELRQLVQAGGVVVLSGAGLSTESGIPDYRGPTGALRTAQPMTYQKFVGDPVARHRYWARSYLGWRQISSARPNAGHVAVARLQQLGRLEGIITQNVDGLHQGAGARDVVELHGGLDRTVCLTCHDRAPRRDLDARLRAANPDFDAHVAAVNPDGDVDLRDEDLGGFMMLDCAACGAGP